MEACPLQYMTKDPCDRIKKVRGKIITGQKKICAQTENYFSILSTQQPETWPGPCYTRRCYTSICCSEINNSLLSTLRVMFQSKKSVTILAWRLHSSHVNVFLLFYSLYSMNSEWIGSSSAFFFTFNHPKLPSPAVQLHSAVNSFTSKGLQVTKHACQISLILTPPIGPKIPKSTPYLEHTSPSYFIFGSPSC